MSNSHYRPYASNASVPPLLGYGGSAEAIRQAHLKHEASVKTIGLLFMLGAVLWCIATVPHFFTAATAIQSPEINPALGGLVFSTICLGVIGVLLFFVGIGLRSLQPWARIVGTIFCFFGLLAFPLGTIISGYFIYVLLSGKGAMVFSDPYKRVIRATPRIKYKTPIAVWFLLAILLGIIAAAAMFITLNSVSPR